LKQSLTNAESMLATPPALRTITRREANVLLRQRAVDRYHEAKTQRESNIQVFEAKYGRCDRINHGLLRDLDTLMLRLSAIHARQRSLSCKAFPQYSFRLGSSKRNSYRLVRLRFGCVAGSAASAQARRPGIGV
jgi:hypothetical protein